MRKGPRTRSESIPEASLTVIAGMRHTSATPGDPIGCARPRRSLPDRESVLLRLSDNLKDGFRCLRPSASPADARFSALRDA